MPLTLPSKLVIQDNKKLRFGIIGGLCFYFGYWATNQFTMFLEPHYLPLLWIDNATPFWPATQWIYHTEVPFLLFSFFSFKSVEIRTRFFWCMMSLIVLCGIIFLVYPTAFPRQLFPIDPTESFHAKALLYFRENIDQPTNCLPSLHVATCFLVAIATIGESKKRGIFAFIMATLIAISTLTTKQHYFVDVAAGIMMTIGVWYGLGKRIQF